MGTNSSMPFYCNIHEREQARNLESILQWSLLFIHIQYPSYCICCTNSRIIFVLQKPREPLLRIHTYTSAWLLRPFPGLFSSSPFCGVCYQSICYYYYNCCFYNWYRSCSYDVGIMCLLNNSRKPEGERRNRKHQELSILICVAISATTLKKKNF